MGAPRGGGRARRTSKEEEDRKAAIEFGEIVKDHIGREDAAVVEAAEGALDPRGSALCPWRTVLLVARQWQRQRQLIPSYEVEFTMCLANSKIIATDLLLPEANSIWPSSEYIK